MASRPKIPYRDCDLALSGCEHGRNAPTCFGAVGRCRLDLERRFIGSPASFSHPNPPDLSAPGTCRRILFPVPLSDGRDIGTARCFLRRLGCCKPDCPQAHDQGELRRSSARLPAQRSHPNGTQWAGPINTTLTLSVPPPGAPARSVAKCSAGTMTGLKPDAKPSKPILRLGGGYAPSSKSPTSPVRPNTRNRRSAKHLACSP